MNAKSHKATDAQLEMCRRDPTQADKIRPDLVVCMECAEMVARLVQSRCHARRAHKLDRTAYLAKWPGAPVSSVNAIKADKAVRKTYVNDNRDALNVQRRAHYADILEKAEADPDSKEATFIHGERNRTADLWNEKYWGAATPEGVKELEAAARANSEGPEADKLRAASEFRESEKKRKKARSPRQIQRARELLEERVAAAKADPGGPEAALLKAQREKDRKEAEKIRDFAKVGKPAVDELAKATGIEITDIHAQAEPLAELVAKVIPTLTKFQRRKGEGGRPRKELEEKEDFKLAQQVDGLIPQARRFLELRARLSTQKEIRHKPELLRAKLIEAGFSEQDVTVALNENARTRQSLARHWVAARTGQTYERVSRAHSEFGRVH